MESECIFDFTQWPLLRARYTAGVYPPERWSEHVIEMQGLIERVKRENTVGGVVCTIDKATSLSPAQRRDAAALVTRNFSTYKSHIGGFAYVVDSPVARGIMTAVAWMTKNPCPMRFFATEAEAIAWVKQVMEEKKRLREGSGAAV